MDLYPSSAPGSQTARDAAETLRATSEGFVAGVQVGGWIGGIVLAIVQGLTELVENVTSAKVRKEQAVAWARALGIPDPEQAPAFIVRVQAMTLQQRVALGVDLTHRLAVTRPGKLHDKYEIQRGIVAILLKLDVARAQQAMPPAAPTSTLIVKYGVQPTTTDGGQMLTLLVVVGAAGIGWLLSR